jgi:hypothetical protein
MCKLIPVHVGWNDEEGETDCLTHVEFTNDCEFMALETNILDGDPIKFLGTDTFLISLTKRDSNADEGERFKFEKLEPHVGNIHWDMLYMTLEEAARFALFLQSQRHWSLNVASTEIFDNWGQFSAEDFQQLITEEMAAS